MANPSGNEEGKEQKAVKGAPKEAAGDKLDEEIEKAYKMAADALSYKLIPVEGYEYNGEQLYIKGFI